MAEGVREVEAFKGGMEAAGAIVMASAFRGFFSSIAQARNDAACRAWAAAPGQTAALATKMTVAALEKAAVIEAEARARAVRARLRAHRATQAAA